MKSIHTFSRIALALSVTAMLMFSVAMPVSAQLPPAQDVSQNVNSSSGGSLSSCGDVVNGASSVVGCIVGIFNTVIYLIISAAVVYIVWGAFTMIRSEEKREEGKNVILYGVIGLFVMVSIWGFVNILVSTFGTNVDTIPLPKLIK